MKRTETKYSYEHANESTTTIQGETWLVWNNYARRSTEARRAEGGETRTIKSMGYLSNDLSVRKAIAASFGLDSFRK